MTNTQKLLELAAQSINLVYEWKCARFHDHNWNTTFEYDPHAKDGYQFKTICGDTATVFD